jgi:hypothetical protein
LRSGNRTLPPVSVSRIIEEHVVATVAIEVSDPKAPAIIDGMTEAARVAGQLPGEVSPFLA